MDIVGDMAILEGKMKMLWENHWEYGHITDEHMENSWKHEHLMENHRNYDEIYGHLTRRRIII